MHRVLLVLCATVVCVFGVAALSRATGRAVPFLAGETLDPGLEAQPCGPTDPNCFPGFMETMDEGTTLATSIRAMKFVGGGVTATESSGIVTVTVPGGGLVSLNGVTDAVQQLIIGTAGSDFNLSTLGSTHILNLPDASSSARGLVTTSAQTFSGAKTFGSAILAPTASNTINGLIINSGALSGIAGMVFSSGGLDLNSGGIANAGSIAGATGLVSSGTITFSGLASGRGLFTTTGGQLTNTGVSQNLIDSLSDETGTGGLVFASSPSLTTPTINTSAVVPLVIGGTSTTSSLILRSTSGAGTSNADIVFQTGSNGATEAMRILNSGNVGIANSNPQARLHLGGAAIADGVTLLKIEDTNSVCNITAQLLSLLCGSDESLKKDIAALDTSDLLTKVSALRPVSFHWHTDATGAPLQFGFIAQEVELQFPDLVKEDQWIDGTQKKFLGMGGLMPYVVGAVKELGARLAAIESRLAGLFEHFSSREVETEHLCLKDAAGQQTCVTKAELDALLLNAAMPPAPPMPVPASSQVGSATEPSELSAERAAGDASSQERENEHMIEAVDGNVP